MLARHAWRCTRPNNAVQRSGTGLVFVALAAITEPLQVVPAIAQVLGLQERPGQALLPTIAAHCGSGATLLILDNFEHVIERGRFQTGVACGVSRTLKLLVTSRIALRLYGEREYPVKPLEMPAATRGRRRHAGRVRRRSALYRPRAGRPTRTSRSTPRTPCDRGDLSAPGWTAARARVGSGTGAGLDARCAGPTSGATTASAHGRRTRSSLASANAARDDRLEPRPAARRRNRCSSGGWRSLPADLRSMPPKPRW